eukprot:COSAG02_NODE_6606_length_3463_cov_1021.220943_4_plen_98_part_00
MLTNAPGTLRPTKAIEDGRVGMGVRSEGAPQWSHLKALNRKLATILSTVNIDQRAEERLGELLSVDKPHEDAHTVVVADEKYVSCSTAGSNVCLVVV